ncbi:MAG: putative transporter permease/ATP-binding protein [Acidimicrobiia bacterium]|nr:putative transporter permease/ATP-binding protein [Acidimicrobiia bacterium]
MSPYGHGRDPSVVDAKVSRAVLWRAWGFARPYRAMIWGFLATIVLDALLALVPPLLIGAIVNELNSPNADSTRVVWLASISVAAALGDGALTIAQRWWSARIGEGLIYQLRTALFDHVQRLPIAFFTRTQTGALISRMNNDVIGAQSAVTGTLGSVVSNVIVLVTTLGAMTLYSWKLTLLSLCVLPIFIIPSKRVGKRLQAISREQMNFNAEMNTQMTERFNVSGAMLVKLFGRHDEETAVFAGRAAGVRDAGIRSATSGRVFFVGLGLAGAVGVAAVYGVGGVMVANHTLKLGAMVTLAALVTRIYQPLTALTNARVDVMTALVSFDRVFEVLDAPRTIDDRPGAVELISPKGRVEFDHVSFAYPPPSTYSIRSLEAPSGTTTPSGAPEVEVLHDINLVIEPGQLVALVGPSGAGKTTLGSLVPRLYDVTAGAVRIDGRDVRDVLQESLRAHIGVVAQDPHLFHETIAANLRYGRPSATAAEMEAACRAAQIHDVIAALPDGYDTLVGERGYRLSGGEKQRVAIARLLIKNPSIVILDEATSHLDAENESLVQVALDHALHGRTSIVIAHRLSTITSADQIVVIDDGRVVETGKHEELLLNRGLYSDLYRTLVGDHSEPVG